MKLIVGTAITLRTYEKGKASLLIQGVRNVKLKLYSGIEIIEATKAVTVKRIPWDQSSV